MREEVEVSVIVPSYGEGPRLSRCVRSILSQDAPFSFEVIVVASADTADELPSDLPDDPRLTLVASVGRRGAYEARNLAMEKARGRHFAYTDAPVQVPRDWLRNLVGALRPGVGCVVGSVQSPRDENLWALSEYLVEFLDLHPRRPRETLWHGAGCNLLLTREFWESHGPWPLVGGGGDTMLTSRAKQAGVFAFAPEASVVRTGRDSASRVLTHQYAIGRYCALLGRSDIYYKARPLVRYTPLAPLAAAGRLVSIYARVFAWHRGARLRSLMAIPLVAACLTAWGWGLFKEGLRVALDRGGR